MELTKTNRGFEWLEHPQYSNLHEPTRLVSASSAIGDYYDSCDRPGTSFLWIGEHHHLDREEVRQLVRHLEAWLETGSMEPK